MNSVHRFQLFIGILSILFFYPCSALAATETLNLTVRTPHYDIEQSEKDGKHVISMDSFSQLCVPGKPLLPMKKYYILLPPQAIIDSVTVTGLHEEPVPGKFDIRLTPAIVPKVKYGEFKDLIAKHKAYWSRNGQANYINQSRYPQIPGKIIDSGSYRQYRYAAVTFCPFVYIPSTGRLQVYNAAKFSITYHVPEQKEPTTKMHCLTELRTRSRAATLFFNYDDLKHLYEIDTMDRNASSKVTDYVIITTSALIETIQQSEFISWKESLGFSMRVVTIADPEIINQAGFDGVEKIRNFLRQYYLSWGIHYVLLVGDVSDIPMRYCYPDPDDHTNSAGNPYGTGGEVPTDYYYADLSDSYEDSWDLDDDGYFGEYGQDIPDFIADVYVGRIPTSSVNRVLYTLNKIVAFEQDTGEWKNSVLHGAAFYSFTNENYSGRDADDGATCLALLEQNVMSDWLTCHYSEQEGLEHSVYPWNPLTESEFTDDWRTGKFGVVNVGAHGHCNGVARKVWSWDDGDGVPESSVFGEITWPYFLDIGSNLDDDFPSIFCAMSCLVGYPESNPTARIGVDLLTKPDWGASIAVISSTRIVYGPLDWPNPAGGCESICYDFNRLLINSSRNTLPVGEAFYHAKSYVHQNHPINTYVEYITMFEYNLYGDPSLYREGRETVQVVPTSTETFLVLVILLSICITLSPPKVIITDILTRRKIN